MHCSRKLRIDRPRARRTEVWKVTWKSSIVARTGPSGEPALATPELSQAIVAFLTHQRRAGQPCSSVTYHGTNRRGQWEFTGSVEYAD